MAARLTQAAERGWLPDFVIRFGIRSLLRQRLQEIGQQQQLSVEEFINSLSVQPLAVATELANAQHYEVPAAFFIKVLGQRLKYSCCYWELETQSLDEAEIASLKLTCEHAELADGMDILELGCGWGSLSLWMAEQYPASHITAVSNSHSQRQYIQAQAKVRGLVNLSVITSDINDFEPQKTFDRVVSVEMFEHIRNHHCLLGRIDRWLRPPGKLFVHIFCHKETPYLFQSYGESNWMGRHFFSGGMMPSFHLLPAVASPFSVEQIWRWNGLHYAKTCRAWLNRQDAAAEELAIVLAGLYGHSQATVWHNRWRIFFMACEELFAYQGGQEWFVGHYLFKKCYHGN